MSVFDRIGKVVRAEIAARFGSEHAPSKGGQGSPPGTDQGQPTTSQAPSVRAPMITDVDGALRALEFNAIPTLEEVRARYRELARRYHPKTRSPNVDEARSAHLLQETLTEALELLEEHLLPMPPAPPSSPPTIVG
jgi:hypothetical protein